MNRFKPHSQLLLFARDPSTVISWNSRETLFLSLLLAFFMKRSFLKDWSVVANMQHRTTLQSKKFRIQIRHTPNRKYTASLDAARLTSDVCLRSFTKHRQRRDRKRRAGKGSINRRHFRTCWGYFTATSSSPSKIFPSSFLFCFRATMNLSVFGNTPVFKHSNWKIQLWEAYIWTLSSTYSMCT